MSDDVKTVLVVDDEQLIRQVIVSANAWKDNYKLIEADSALRAHEIVTELNYSVDAIVLDLKMPGLRGEEFLKWIKDVRPQIAVVVLTGTKDEEALIQCLQAGATEYIIKPFIPDQLVSIIERAILKQSTLSEKRGDISAHIVAENWVEITAPSEMEYLSRMQSFSDRIFALRFPEDVCEDLRMAMEELGRNAIEWGNHLDRQKKFKISYCIFDDRIVLKFEDEGEGFQWKEMSDPSKDPVAHMEDRKKKGKRPGGYGIFLMSNMMDAVVYNEKGNMCLMTKYLPAST